MRCIIEHVARPDVATVVGCVAWFSNKRILCALSKKPGGAQVVMCDLQNTKSRAWPAGLNVRIFRIGGGGRGRNRPIMHHKFLVGLDVNGSPRWVITGSFNMTAHAIRNRENIVPLYDPTALAAYLAEFQTIWDESNPVSRKRVEKKSSHKRVAKSKSA